MSRTRSRATKSPDGSQEFYCSFGKHRTWLYRHIPTEFENATMCLDCQMAVVKNLSLHLDMPDMTVAIRVHECREKAAIKAATETTARIRGGSDAQGVVYYLRINGQIKIGYSANVTQRMRNYPPGSELLAIEPGSPHLERQRHQDFNRDLVRGREWFTESPKLAAHIVETFNAYGDPSALAYKYTQPKPN
jgi:hypothetical protein